MYIYLAASTCVKKDMSSVQTFKPNALQLFASISLPPQSNPMLDPCFTLLSHPQMCLACSLTRGRTGIIFELTNMYTRIKMYSALLIFIAANVSVDITRIIALIDIFLRSFYNFRSRPVLQTIAI